MLPDSQNILLTALAEQMLPTPKISSLKTVIDNFYLNIYSGAVVSLLAFNLNDSSSNRTKVFSFYCELIARKEWK